MIAAGTDIAATWQGGCMVSARIRRWDGSDEQLRTIAEIYAAVFAEPPYGEDPAENLRTFPARVRRYEAEKPELRLLVAWQDSAIVGFVLGTGIAGGDWWRDHLVEAIDPVLAETWLGDECFSVAELAVSVGHRRSGIAAALMDAVLDALPYTVAVLGCTVDAVAAQQFYRSQGWKVLVPSLRIADSPASSLFGLRLR
jgi:ribosomal protein S18 acetylase RimI-like enzyme